MLDRDDERQLEWVMPKLVSLAPFLSVSTIASMLFISPLAAAAVIVDIGGCGEEAFRSSAADDDNALTTDGGVA